MEEDSSSSDGSDDNESSTSGPSSLNVTVEALDPSGSEATAAATVTCVSPREHHLLVVNIFRSPCLEWFVLRVSNLMLTLVCLFSRVKIQIQ